jgi:hypothetical protein
LSFFIRYSAKHKNNILIFNNFIFEKKSVYGKR